MQFITCIGNYGENQECREGEKNMDQQS